MDASNPDREKSRVSRIEKLADSDLELRVHASFDNPGSTKYIQRLIPKDVESHMQHIMCSDLFRGLGSLLTF